VKIPLQSDKMQFINLPVMSKQWLKAIIMAREVP